MFHEVRLSQENDRKGLGVPQSNCASASKRRIDTLIFPRKLYKISHLSDIPPSICAYKTPIFRGMSQLRTPSLRARGMWLHSLRSAGGAARDLPKQMAMVWRADQPWDLGRNHGFLGLAHFFQEINGNKNTITKIQQGFSSCVSIFPVLESFHGYVKYVSPMGLELPISPEPELSNLLLPGPWELLHPESGPVVLGRYQLHAPHRVCGLSGRSGTVVLGRIVKRERSEEWKMVKRCGIKKKVLQ